jgi:hypothetical protein
MCSEWWTLIAPSAYFRLTQNSSKNPSEQVPRRGRTPATPHCDQLATMKMRVRDDVQQALPPSRC